MPQLLKRVVYSKFKIIMHTIPLKKAAPLRNLNHLVIQRQECFNNLMLTVPTIIYVKL